MSLRTQVNGRVHGALRRLVRLKESLQDRWFDVKYGTETAVRVELDELGVDGEHARFSMPYQATLADPFMKLMEVTGLSRDNVFVDIGSGKGRVLLLASEYGFRKVVGVEFSRELCEAARENIAIYERKVKREANIEIVESDAAEYQIGEDDSVFFLFNTFGEEAMREFLANVVRSLDEHPRKLWLIYHNPTCREIVEGLDAFRKEGEYIFSAYGDPFVVYVTK